MAVAFEVTLLGVNSAIPVNGRHPSCQVVRYDNVMLMIDCGEGTQQQLSRYHIKRSKISDIFISHLHGDHCFGLPGMLTTESLQRRTTPLTVHGPVGLKRFIETVLECSGSVISYELTIIEYSTVQRNVIPIGNDLEVSTFPLDHRIPTMGFLVKEKNISRNILPEKIEQLGLSIAEIKAVKDGSDITRAEHSIANADLIKPVESRRAYAYVSDTKYNIDVVDDIVDATTLYHETTYLDDMKVLAAERMHTTIGGAVDIALRAKCRQLITGHYSSRYKDVRIFETEGRKLWNGVQLGIEGKTYAV